MLVTAHGLVPREDLPLPEWLFAWGASVVLIISFVGLTLSWREARLEGEGWRGMGERLPALLVNRLTEALAGLLGVLLLAVVVWSGLAGTAVPEGNFSVVFVFVTFWIGLAVASVLFGNIFRALNPWRAIGRASAAGFARLAGSGAPAPLAYPERLGRWPAVIGLVGFGFLELVWSGPTGVDPRDVAIATIVYSAITFAGMALFGIERWISRGETFSVYFGMFASLAVFEVRDGRLGRRRPLAGAKEWVSGVPGSLAMVLVAIGVTTFDGASEGALTEPISDLFATLTDAGLSSAGALRLTNTLFYAATLAGVAAIFWAGIAGMRTVERSLGLRQLSNAFAGAFIPIALGYIVAHYFSLFVFMEQAQFTYLLSDPLGEGWDLFGTAGAGVNWGLIGGETIWYVQVGALVVGHVTALVMGHDRAIALLGDDRSAARSQYWMLAMMIAFTTLGLFLLSQSNA